MSSGTGRHRVRRLAISTAILVMAGPLIFAAAFAVKAYQLPPLNLATAEETSVVVLDREGRLLRPYATKEGRWRLPVQLEELDKDFVRLLLTYEDRNFYQHAGVDYFGLMRAALQFLTNGKIISGGSTITMQLARLLEGLETKSFDAKLTQLVRAYQIESTLSKKEILSLYLNLAPYGGNLEGVRAASLAYFGKEPKRLNWSERALLVALPQSPETRRPDRHPKNTKRAVSRVLQRAEKAGLVSVTERKYSTTLPIPKTRVPFPRFAAHLADLERDTAPSAKKHKLTIDRPLQKKLETLAKQSAQAVGRKLSVAILVADHSSAETLAYVGSPGYLDHERQGAINMVQAARSPGSALKPFIYGLTFERGIAHPETLIEDRPTNFENYAPKNFDKKFRGTVSIREALQKSLNIPAVKALDAVGPARLAARFEQHDKDLTIPRNLSVALGGVGISLKSLTSLYASLANGGKHVHLLTRKIDKKLNLSANNTPLLSPLAAWYVTDILAGAKPPKNASRGRIAFKTGTSYGYRDAWAVGFDGKHVIGVWIGRPDGTPTANLTGLATAAPILFDAFSRISATRTPLKAAPSSAIRVKTSKLPKPLLYFKANGGDAYGVSNATNDSLKIAFPPNNAELDLGPGGQEDTMPVVLKAEGGHLPLTWLADGAPLKTTGRRRNAFFKPQGPGFHNLTVIDATGKTDHISIRIR